MSTKISAMPSTTDLRLVRALRLVPLFSCCDDNEISTIAGFSRFLVTDQDTRLFGEGERCTAFFFVVEGLVELFRTLGPAKRKVVEFIGSGEAFAEAPVFSGQNYPVSAVTVIPSQVVHINAAAFRRFLETRPGVQSSMLAALAIRLHQLMNQITELSLLNAEQRVAAYLLKNRDADDPDAPVGNLPYRRKDLASRLNLTPETLCRVLGTFRKRGWVDMPSSSRLLVTDAGALRSVLKSKA